MSAPSSDDALDSFAPDLTSEWRTRPINLFSVLKSFVYQLRPGQDLTRVSLPTELCYPFSALEFLAVRLLECMHGLFALEDEDVKDDPKKRFVAVLRWYLSMLREGEAVYTTRKPFNSVINEIHHAWVDYESDLNKDVLNESTKKRLAGTASEGWSTFVSEQVSHHPPVMAFVAENKAHGIRFECSAGFEVKFGSNSASVVVIGPMTIKTPRETYVLSQAIPNLMIKNVVWGTKYIMFEGPFSMYCVDSGYCATLDLREDEGQVNAFSGSLTLEQKEVAKIAGRVGLEGHLTEGSVDTPFFSGADVKRARITYLPASVQSPFESMQVWKVSNAAIVANDIVGADTAKKEVEAAQRIRQKQRIEAGLMAKGRYFERKLADGEEHHDGEHSKPATFTLTHPLSLPEMVWTYKDNVSFSPEGLQEMKETALKEQEEVKRLKEEAEKAAAENPQQEGDGSCVIS